MSRWIKGSKVEALDEDGVWYPGTIGAVHRDGTYRVDWAGKWADTYSARMPAAKIRSPENGRTAGGGPAKPKRKFYKGGEGARLAGMLGRVAGGSVGCRS